MTDYSSLRPRPGSISEQIWDQKYRLKSADGSVIDRDLEATFKRVARAAAMVEKKDERKKWRSRFADVMGDFSFLPGGRILAGAGSGRAFPGIAQHFAQCRRAELKHIPLYGWFSRKFKMIFVARSTGPSALRKMLRDAGECAAQGRQIIIFPEGTRRPPDAEPDYKPGILLLYDGLDVPCVPVALNSGLFWPRRKFMRYPGTIIVEFLDPIEPGLERAEFKERLESAIETATAALVAEGREADIPRHPSDRTK